MYFSDSVILTCIAGNFFFKEMSRRYFGNVLVLFSLFPHTSLLLLIIVICWKVVLYINSLPPSQNIQSPGTVLTYLTANVWCSLQVQEILKLFSSFFFGRCASEQ